MIIGGLIVVPLVWAVGSWWPDRRDLFKEHCAKLRHPAEQALSRDQAAQLETSWDYESPYAASQRRIRDAYDSDSGGF
ncbi:hypothetical protein ACFPIJ_45655 [Dactylosporangium cerinum]|uniref:Uncharacterized protein n=1 Tax=Dactylosporangium cerinum TaxID=1434730 RepID=A0ABV9WA83_9ACTN